MSGVREQPLKAHRLRSHDRARELLAVGIVGIHAGAVVAATDLQQGIGRRWRCTRASSPINAGVGTLRKIIHIDMDAFYASVEQRDEPSLKGQPVIVGWPGERSVVCAASYEARKFGVHSAMPATRAKRLCPDGVFIHPNFEKYRAVSKEIRAIFERHTPLVEPLSLDEAYLDVTQELTGIPTATETAETIRREIRAETDLTASAGVAPNKFLAKIASDWKKPDGLFVIRPHQVERFLIPLAVRKIPGVGKATEAVLTEMGVATVGDLHRFSAEELVARFGKWGTRLW